MKPFVTLIAMTVAAGALAQPAATKDDFAERFAQMQVQSGAKFPTAPMYRSASEMAAGSAAQPQVDRTASRERTKAAFAERFAELQLQSGAKFPAAPPYGSASMTALAERERATRTQVR